ncbi:hypothetical protein [Xanthomonas hortorum]|uniref:Uncharacterized protein n=1 Tax=Xanthomonas hortorum pv. gardneri TaxID=2754056 RepID=A0A6V7BQQ7_9XANT|nr:hypothetical protein [Xanthomonas hortorum]MCC4624314.1 hypothetical protein [Xanthomonas campestris pv. nigromaculans]APP82129.1 hypothetical protein BJD10_22845 [Xanthomonas hortorum pv. gardneri]EGD17951.1 hypothetical protein XGA_3439 [Xanthomonas hortorum ATCC 19865]KLA99657.1 hypothetical protein SM17710_09095 [Xanthomonas hortorum pv. gardneri]KLB01074.1 hypothetical protein SM19410_03795 [Xanthomonas hortorum pv. gardneri]
MTPRKTELAVTALQSHRSPLTLLQRRTLILADGQRDLATLAQLLGGDAATLVQTLCAMGYLQLGEADAGAGGAPGTSAATEPTSAAPVQPTDAQQTEEDLQRQRRRAATNARLYLLDILQLQRNPAAAALHRQLQAARAEDAIGAAIAEALRELPQITSATYAERVRARIGELLPDTLQAA